MESTPEKKKWWGFAYLEKLIKQYGPTALVVDVIIKELRA
jgi:hypothetical protein